MPTDKKHLLQQKKTKFQTPEVEVLRLLDEIERIRKAMGGYPDSDLVSLATTLRSRAEALEHIDRCCCCDKQFKPAQLSGICDTCYEDRIA